MKYTQFIIAACITSAILVPAAPVATYASTHLAHQPGVVDRLPFTLPLSSSSDQHSLSSRSFDEPIVTGTKRGEDDSRLRRSKRLRERRRPYPTLKDRMNSDGLQHSPDPKRRPRPSNTHQPPLPETKNKLSPADAAARKQLFAQINAWRLKTWNSRTLNRRIESQEAASANYDPAPVRPTEPGSHEQGTDVSPAGSIAYVPPPIHHRVNKEGFLMLTPVEAHQK